LVNLYSKLCHSYSEGRRLHPERQKNLMRIDFRVWKAHLVLAHDLLIAAFSIILALYLRLGVSSFQEYADDLAYRIPLFVIVAGVTFHAFGMYRGLWRYASVPDLMAIIKAVTVALLVFMPLMFLINRLDEMPRSVPIIQWFLLVVLLGGPRFIYRMVHSRRWALDRSASRQVPVILVGTSDNAALFIRAMSSDPDAPYSVVGILDRTGDDIGRRIHSVPVLGRTEQLEEVVDRIGTRGLRPQRVILADPPDRLDAERFGRLLERAEALGLSVARLPSLVDFRSAVNDNRIELRPIALEDLLGRPQTRLNHAAIQALIAGRRVLVTGAGGTIGGELTRQIAAFGPATLTLADSSEFNLYSIDMELREQHVGMMCSPVLCNIRDRERVMQLFETHRPELVFHAAALKHVPMVELNPGEGVLTNVIGTRNVADAAARYGALAMVQISTDKAINPTSVMGATKRLAELYCQALDLSAPAHNGSADSGARFMTVRFGNVLGSSGSVVPLFERQLARGGPLTVTHPEIRRFFMTVREAVELVLQASAYGINQPEHRGQIFVLDMGKAAKIVDIARQMIRLAGLRPEVDIKIEFTGLRPGEKLYEELFDDQETRLPAAVDGVLVATSCPIELKLLRRAFDELAVIGRDHERLQLQRAIARVLPTYQPEQALEEEAMGSESAATTLGAKPGGRLRAVDLEAAAGLAHISRSPA
jgi:FlaA1/EpsC-like NDP-sugar epimerase